MISDYSKTTELIGAAYDSAGSGQAQFEKTLDSLEAKLTKLKNAWDEFTMGLTNNEIIGTIVEVFTEILTAINNIIDAVSGGNGLIKSILTLIATFGGLKLGGVMLVKALSTSFATSLLNAIKGNATENNAQGAAWYKKGVEAAKKYWEGFRTSNRTFGEMVKDFKAKGGVKAFGQKISEKNKNRFYNPPQLNSSQLSPLADSGEFVALNPDDNLYRQVEADALIAKYKEGKIAADEFKKGLSDLKFTNGEEIAGQIDAANNAAFKGAVQWKELSKAAYTTGAALTGIGTIITKLIPGGEEFGKVIQYIGLGITGLGSVISLFSKQLDGLFVKIMAFKAAHPEIFSIIVALTALAAVAALVINTVNNNSIEKKLEKAAEATQKAKEAAEEAAQVYDDLVDKKKSLAEMESKLDSLTEGTLEWKKAIIDINNEILTLKDTYDNLELTYDEKTGKLGIANWDEIIEQQLNQVKAANASYVVAQVKENNLSARKDKDEVNNNKDLEKGEKQAKLDAIDYNNTAANQAVISSLIEGEFASEIGKFLSMSEDYTVNIPKYRQVGREKRLIGYETETRTLNPMEGLKATAEAKYKDLGEEALKKKYIEIFGEGSEEGLDKETMRSNLENYDIANSTQELNNKLESLSETQQQAFKAMFGSFSGNLEDLSSLSVDAFDSQELLEMGSTMGITDILTLFGPHLEQMKKEGEVLQQKFADILKEEVPEGFFNISFDVLKNLESQISGMGETAAGNYLRAFNDFVSKADENGMGDALANYLSTVDFSDVVDVSNAIDYMESLGLDKTEIEAFWRDINRSCKPYITSLEQISSLTSKISNLGSVRELVDEGQQTFSSEDKTSLVNIGFQDSDFIQTGFDEWTYIGDETNTLLEQIDQKVGLISNQIIGGLENSIELGEEYSKFAPEGSQLYKDLKTLSESGYEGSSFDDDTIKKMAKDLNLDVYGLNTQGIAEKLIDAYSLITNLETNRKQLETQQVNSASLQYELNGDFGIYTDSLTPDQQDEIIEAHLKKNAGAMEYYNELLEKNEELKEKLEKENKKFDVQLANEAIQLTKTTSRYKDVAKSISNYRDALKQGTSAGSDFYTAIDSARSDLANLFQIDEALITQDFIKDNIQNIYALAEGGEAGTAAFQALWEQLKNIQLEDFKTKVGDMGGDVSQFVNWIDNLDPNIGIGTEISTEGLESGLKEMAERASDMGLDVAATLSPVVSQLEALTGTKINIEYEEVAYSGGKYLSAKSIEGLLAQGWRVGSGGKLVRTKSISTVSATKGGGSNLTGFVAPDLSSGSGSSSDKTSTWLNPYDKLYNLTEQINEQLRQREKLEREYDRILERRGATFQELRKNYNNQLASLEKELALQEQLRKGRLEQLANVASERYKGQDADGNELIQSYEAWGVTKYASYDPDKGVITIDWDAIDKVTDEEKGAAIEDYISRLEELQEQIEAIDEQVEDFQDRILELQKEGMSDYLDFEQKVYDALVAQQQKLIDEFQDLSDAIYDSNQEILDDLQESIDLQRQIRDNTKTEEDLADKETRLAYLRRDTSNANLMEIKELEDELADSRQDYEDSLIDQQIERLTQQNDDAQEAREKQIELMQAQLDYAEKNGEFWEEAYGLINSGFSANGELSAASQLWALLQEDEGWKGMSKFGQINWQEEISKAILAASQGYANWNMYKAEQIDKSLTLGDGTVLTYDGKDWKDSSGNVYNGVDYDSTQQQFTYEGMTPNPSQPAPSNPGNEDGNTGSTGEKSINIGSSVKADPKAKIYSNSYGGGGNSQYYANDPYYTVVDKNNDYFLTRYHKLHSGYTGWFKKKDLTAYKTGGVADFTGPAWLDGTKSKPELILNAKDTENFIMLKDILRAFMAGHGNATEDQKGDFYFDIDINVDEISDDYDVDDLAARVKKELTDAAMYRNVNLVNYIR